MGRTIALVLTMLTGFTGLVYEVLWQRYLATLLGSHSEATAAVLGIFLGGLSVGYWLFGRVARAIVERSQPASPASRLLHAYGLVEAAIGLYAFAFPFLFAAARTISLSLPHVFEGAAFALDVVVTALLIGPPTVLMGGTIPLLTQGLSTGLADATRFHALVYASNTVGAFFGAVAGGFFLLAWLGLRNGVFAMGVINLAAGLVFLALGRRAGTAVATESSAGDSAFASSRAGDPPAAVQGFFAYAAVALLAGFAMMALQVTLNRIGALALGASHFTFAIVVAAFVLCIAIGSLAVSVAPRIPRAALAATQWSLVGLLLLLYPAVGDATYWAHALRSLFRDQAAGFYPFHLAVLIGILTVWLVPLALSGAALPLLFHHLRRETADLGAVAGRLYSWNTVGSLLGALLAGYALLFWLDLHHVYRLAVASLAAAAAIASVATLPRGGWVAALGLAVTTTALVAQSPWHPVRLSAGLFRLPEPTRTTYAGAQRFFETLEHGRDVPKLLFYDDDPITSVAVAESFHDGKRSDLSIVVNGKSDGNIVGDNVTMRMLALVPALFARSLESAFVIGYGTGVTAGELAAHPGAGKITVAEISPAVLDAAAHFESFNGNVLANPAIDIVRSDAYRALLRSSETYDVIISEPSNPWVTGVEMLFTEEFLRAARERLRPGGVHVQWFHTYSMSADTIGLVLGTYRRVFPQASVWFTNHNDVLLVGLADESPGIDMTEVLRRWSDPQRRGRFERIGIATLGGLLAHEILPAGVLASASAGAPAHTLLHPRLSHDAARAFFANQAAAFPSTSEAEPAGAGARNSLLQRYRALISAEEWRSMRASITTQGCLLDATACMTHLAAWSREDPGAAGYTQVMAGAQSMWGDDVDPELIPYLVKLFDDSGTASLPAQYAYAESVFKLFRKHYLHAFPFDAGALHGPWRRCRAAGDSRCEASLAAVESIGIELPLAASDE